MKNNNQKLAPAISMELGAREFKGGSQWQIDVKVIFSNSGDSPCSILSCSTKVTPDGTNVIAYNEVFPVNIPPHTAVSLSLHIEFSLSCDFPQSLELEFKDQHENSIPAARQIL